MTDQASTAGVPEGERARPRARTGEPERSAAGPGGGSAAHGDQPLPGQPGPGAASYPPYPPCPPDEEQDGDDEYVPA
jgi:hypothetical protein